MVSISAISISEFETSGISALDLLKLLPFSSREKLERITNSDSYSRSLLGEVLARYAIGQVSGLRNADIHFDIAEKGKPHLKDSPNLHFNITHSSKMVACAVAGSEIGIDIEHFRRVNFRVAERFFSPSEIKDLLELDLPTREEYFFTLWTIKESFLKAIGSGLTRNLNSFSVLRAKDGFVLTGDDLSESFSIRTFNLPENYFMAVCTQEIFIPGNVQMVRLQEILEFLADSE